jgi:hypothetical protein
MTHQLTSIDEPSVDHHVTISCKVIVHQLHTSCSYRILSSPWLQALHRYCKFLHLANVKKGLMVVPMYDIDLMWHTHISMDPSAYREHCRSAIGWVSSPLCPPLWQSYLTHAAMLQQFVLRM